ncbi:hypothetical protein EK904_014272 [Melospiza melodia maxima]|nr:hypothetical protein EK904_014272 [Melospiza melodia maxima]
MDKSACLSVARISVFVKLCPKISMLCCDNVCSHSVYVPKLAGAWNSKPCSCSLVLEEQLWLESDLLEKHRLQARKKTSFFLHRRTGHTGEELLACQVSGATAVAATSPARACVFLSGDSARAAWLPRWAHEHLLQGLIPEGGMEKGPRVLTPTEPARPGEMHCGHRTLVSRDSVIYLKSSCVWK